MNVRFLFRPSKVYTTRGTILCRVTIDGKRAPAFATGVELNRADWNSRLQQVKGRSSRAQTDNNTLERIRGKLVNIFNYFDTNGMSYTAHTVKEVYAGNRSVQYTLTQLIDEFLQSERGRVGPADEQISGQTYRGKANRLSHLQEWIATGGRQGLLAKDVTAGIAQQWIEVMQRHYKRNYIAKHIDLLQEVLNWGVRNEFIVANRLLGFKFTRQKPSRPEFLHVDQIQALEAFEPNDIPVLRVYGRRLHDVRDMLLFMCAVGMHYADYNRLSSDDLRTYPEGTYIVLFRRKTGEEAIIPLSPLAKRLIEQYGSIEQLPRPSNQQANKLLKVIGVAMRLDKRMSTKFGRRSFTDYYLNVMGWPMEKLLKMLGLTSSQYIAHYGQIDHRSLRLDDPGQKEQTERELLKMFEEAISCRFRLKGGGDGITLEDVVAGVDWKYLHVQGQQYGNFHVSLCELIG